MAALASPPNVAPEAQGTAIRSDRLHALMVSPLKNDFLELRVIFDRNRWTLEGVPTYWEALKFLNKDRVPVVISDSQLPDGGWKDVLSQVSLLTTPPCLLVISHYGEEELWGEVLEEGAFDVIVKPFEEPEVERVVRSAWLYWSYRGILIETVKDSPWP
jgi:DNA-binding NtrC family response regulator